VASLGLAYRGTQAGILDSKSLCDLTGSQKKVATGQRSVGYANGFAQLQGGQTIAHGPGMSNPPYNRSCWTRLFLIRGPAGNLSRCHVQQEGDSSRL